MKAFAPVAILALGLAGCAAGPDYRGPPEVKAAPGWVEGDGDGGAVDRQWWTRLGDSRLSALIAEADAASPGIKAAEARLREARANRDAAAGGRLPQVNLQGSATTNRLSENGQIPIGRIPGFDRDFDLYDAGFDASWEIDLWGHQARQVEAAGARAEAAEAARRGVLVNLHAEIAQSYVDLRAAQARLASLKAQAQADGQLAALTARRFEAGEGSRLDAERAQAQADATAARLPGVEADVRAAAYRLALLAGRPPEGLDQAWLDPAPVPVAPDGIAMGLRSDLLRRRPDLVSAERALAAATADVGVATAELFPRLSLLGSVGQQARDPGDLASAASLRFQFGPSLHWPVFAADTIRARVRAAGARADAAAADYEKAVLTALSESETAANRFVRAGEARDRSLAARNAQARALDLARQRYRAGEDDLLSALQAETAFAAADQAAIDAQAGRTRAAIALYKALGGGWE